MRHLSYTSLLWITAISAVGCSAGSSSVPANSTPTGPIPRFPAGGIPTQPMRSDARGIDSSTVAEGSSTSFSNPEPDSTALPDQHTSASLPGSSTGKASRSEEPRDSSSTPSGEDRNTSSDTSSSDSSSGVPIPAQAPFVDAAYLKIITFDNGTVFESFKFESPQDEHQYLRVGNRRITNYGGKDSGNIERRSYLVFDVSQLPQAFTAQIQIFAFASSNTTNGHGGYESPDPFETVEIRAIDRFSAKQFIEAPFNNNQVHDLDLALFADLADGDLYASRQFSDSDFALASLVPTPTASALHNNCSDTAKRACGRWFTFELSPQAVRAINQSTDTWISGWSMPTISHHEVPPGPPGSPSEVIDEWLFVGGFFDLNSTKPSYPSYLGPQPRLLINP